MELEELLCLELWCLNRPGYFLSNDCSLLQINVTVSQRPSPIRTHVKAASVLGTSAAPSL